MGCSNLKLKLEDGPQLARNGVITPTLGPPNHEQMKVLNPLIWATTPKNKGCGFPRYSLQLIGAHFITASLPAENVGLYNVIFENHWLNMLGATI